MAYRKKTLRQMPPETRKVARLISELDSVSKRLKNLIPTLQTLEMEARAKKRWEETYEAANEPLDLD